jgi:hypothetical protein
VHDTRYTMRQTFKHSLADYRLVCLFFCSTSSHSDNRMRPAPHRTALHRTAPHRTAVAPHCTAPHRRCRCHRRRSRKAMRCSPSRCCGKTTSTRSVLEHQHTCCSFYDATLSQRHHPSKSADSRTAICVLDANVRWLQYDGPHGSVSQSVGRGTAGLRLRLVSSCTVCRLPLPADSLCQADRLPTGCECVRLSVWGSRRVAWHAAGNVARVIRSACVANNSIAALLVDQQSTTGYTAPDTVAYGQVRRHPARLVLRPLLPRSARRVSSRARSHPSMYARRRSPRTIGFIAFGSTRSPCAPTRWLCSSMKRPRRTSARIRALAWASCSGTCSTQTTRASPECTHEAIHALRSCRHRHRLM